MHPQRVGEHALLKLIQSRTATSQVDLATALGVPANTVHGMVKRLVRSGVLVEESAERGGRGRPKKHLGICFRGKVLAIHLTGTEWHAAVVDSDPTRQVPYYTHRRTRLPGGQAALSTFLKVRDAALREAGVPLKKLAGAIVFFNRPPTTFRSSIISWAGGLSEAALGGHLGCRTFVSTQFSRAELELRLWARDGVGSVAIFNVGDGVSAVCAARVGRWGETHHLAGEVGHVRAANADNVCGCGNKGCLETLLSGPNLMERVRNDLAKGARSVLAEKIDLPPAAFFDALESLEREGNDPYICGLVEEFLTHCAWGVSVAANMFDPDLMVLGGYGLLGRTSWMSRISKHLPGLILPLRESLPHLDFSRTQPRDVLRELASEFWIRSAFGRRNSAMGEAKSQ